MCQNYKCLNGLILKIIALVTMFIDHFGAVFMPYQMGYRYIGRIAFPIFVFLLVEGFYHTRNLRRYESNLLVFCLISEIPFDLAFGGQIFDWSHQNVFFTLFLGLVMLDLMKKGKGNLFLEMALLILFMLVAYFLHTDYRGGGILWIYIFYKFRNKYILQTIILAVSAWCFYGSIELYCLFAMIPIVLYNGKRGFVKGNGWYNGRKNGVPAIIGKYIFYILYPLHLFVFYGISCVIG